MEDRVYLRDGFINYWRNRLISATSKVRRRLIITDVVMGTNKVQLLARQTMSPGSLPIRPIGTTENTTPATNKTIPIIIKVLPIRLPICFVNLEKR